MRKLVLLGTAGLALAVGVGFAANAISRDSIGLAPTPAGSGIELSPARTTGAASNTQGAARPKATKPKAAQRTGSATTTRTGTTTSATGAPTSADDHGGRSRGGSGGGSGGGGSGGGRGGDD